MRTTRIHTRFLLISVFVILLLSATWVALAEAPGYTLDWWTVDDGGIMSAAGGGYTLSGTIGQPDAGVLNGDGYLLNGGFWAGALVSYRNYIYLPLTLR